MIQTHGIMGVHGIPANSAIFVGVVCIAVRRFQSLVNPDCVFDVNDDFKIIVRQVSNIMCGYDFFDVNDGVKIVVNEFSTLTFSMLMTTSKSYLAMFQISYVVTILLVIKFIVSSQVQRLVTCATRNEIY